MRTVFESFFWVYGRVFLSGVGESRSDYTTNPGEDFIEIYDAGRALGRWVFRLD